MKPLDNEDIYGNITNNNGSNEDSSLNELKDLAVEINDAEIKIDMGESQIPISSDANLYQFDETANSDSGIEYHEQLPYENTPEINYNVSNTEESSFANVYEDTSNDVVANEHSVVPNEEIEQSTYQAENTNANNEMAPENEISFEYNNNEISDEIENENENAYTPTAIGSVPVEMPEEQDVVESEQFQEDYESNQEEGYTPNYQEEESNNEVQEEESLPPKRNFAPILMAILAIVVFFVVLNLPQVKEKINGNKTEDIQKEQIEELNELSTLNNPSGQVDEKNQDKRAKMVVFDEEQKETSSNNVKICANPFLPTMSVGDNGGNDNSLGAYEIIGPPSGSEIDNSVEVSTMMETKVSGILYDRDNPQAILNYDGQDQLVRRGDRLAGFYVMSITPDKVILKQGNNVYRVSVGQTVTDEGINYNVNSILGKQFGGRYKNIKGKIININE